MFDLKRRKNFDIETLVRRGKSAATTREYNCDLRRLLPWPDVVDTKRSLTEFGAIWVSVRPGEDVDQHRHDEEECFVVFAGKADLHLEGQKTTLEAGDVVYIPRFWMHQLCNPYREAFQFIDLYWDDKGRNFEAFEAELSEALA